MKKALLVALLCISLLSVSARPTYAVTVFCTNCSTIFQQIPQFVKDTITAAQTTITAINTYAEFLKITVLDPLQNALIASTLLMQQMNTLNLVTGGLNGQSLLVEDPEKWIKNQGLNLVKLSVTDIEQANGIYSGSILGTVINNYRSGSDLKTTLMGLTRSPVPGIVQNNFCLDANLTKIATNDVMQSDGDYDLAAMSARKQELYNMLCRGNPNTNIALSKTLNEVASLRPDIAGTESFLAKLTSNEYTNAVQANIAIALGEQEREELAKDNLVAGGGIVNATKCKDPAPDEGVNIANLPCRIQSVTNVGSVINQAMAEAINAPMERLINSYGTNILGTLGTLLSAKNTIDLMKNAFGNIAGSSSGGTGGGASPANDLANSPEAKETVTKPIRDLLDLQATVLTNLEAAHSKLIIEVGRMEQTGQSIGACYQNLVQDNIVPESDSRVQQGYAYRASKTNEMSTIRATIAKDEVSIAESRSIITDFKTKLTNIQSSGQVQALFNEYQEKIKGKNIPEHQTVSAREAATAQLQGDNMTETMEGGAAYTLDQQCTSIRQQWLLLQQGTP